MTSALGFRPIIPAWLTIIVAVALCGLAIWFLIKQPRQRTEWILRALMVVAVAGILLRPGIGQTNAGSVTTNLEIMVVVDRTTSMSARDWNGDESRLTGVKRDLADLTEEFPGARFSLITFARFVRTVLPFSSDTGAFLAAVETMQREEVFDGAGSSVSIAREEMQKTLERAAEQNEDRQRLVIFISDGENTADQPRESFEDLADDVSGGAVFGYGTTEGGRMPINEDRPEGSYVYDEKTLEDARSKLDEKSLKGIAEEMGDLTYLHREQPGGLAKWAEDVQQGFVASDDQANAKHELYWIFALLLFGLALAELRISWRGLLSARRELKSL